MKRPHHYTAAILLVCAYVGAMLFFAIVRAFGLLWFQVEYQYTVFNPWAGFILSSLLWWVDGFVKIKTVATISIKKAIFISFGMLFVLIMVNVANLPMWIVHAICVLAILIVPLIVNKDKARSSIYPLLYLIAINTYTLLMIWGRGYPLIGIMYPSWGIISIFDYRMFLIGILILKGVVLSMPPNIPHCWFFWGKFDQKIAKFGSVITKPLNRFAKNDETNED